MIDGIPETIGILVGNIGAFGSVFPLYFTCTTVEVIAGKIVCFKAAIVFA
jgi:hypothetical protein